MLVIQGILFMVSQGLSLAKTPVGKRMDKAVFFSSKNSGINTEESPWGYASTKLYQSDLFEFADCFEMLSGISAQRK